MTQLTLQTRNVTPPHLSAGTAQSRVVRRTAPRVLPMRRKVSAIAILPSLSKATCRQAGPNSWDIGVCEVCNRILSTRFRVTGSSCWPAFIATLPTSSDAFTLANCSMSCFRVQFMWQTLTCFGRSWRVSHPSGRRPSPLQEADTSRHTFGHSDDAER